MINQSTALKSEGLHPLTELCQGMKLTVNPTTYRARFCKSNRMYFLNMIEKSCMYGKNQDEQILSDYI